MGKPANIKQAMEKLCLQNKVDVLWGTSGSHLTAIIQAEAEKYKKLHLNSNFLSDTLMEGKSFTPYTFQYIWTTYSVERTVAKFFGDRKERKFYILNQRITFSAMSWPSPSRPTSRLTCPMPRSSAKIIILCSTRT